MHEENKETEKKTKYLSIKKIKESTNKSLKKEGGHSLRSGSFCKNTECEVRMA